ncbi:MAG: hypothetical protein E6K93_02325 [Thaumarchaeota archaeon]|nr:MAG: hypothetical protein E6K93_02325 [Nitrososphaerota archaeon]
MTKEDIISESLENTTIQSDGNILPFYQANLSTGETENYLAKSNEWITIEQSSIRELILKAFSDFDKKAILSLTSERALTIPEILYRRKLPNTAGYRKINSLIKAGFIVPSGFVSIKNRKKVKKYMSIFEDARIYIDKDNVTIKVKLKRQ